MQRELFPRGDVDEVVERDDRLAIAPERQRKGDGPVSEYRRWAQQFYPEPETDL